MTVPQPPPPPVMMTSGGLPRLHRSTQNDHSGARRSATSVTRLPVIRRFAFALGSRCVTSECRSDRWRRELCLAAGGRQAELFQPVLVYRVAPAT